MAIPEEIMRGVKSLGEFYPDTLRKEKSVDRVFFYPAGTLEPGERTGKYRLGKDYALTREQESDAKAPLIPSS